jgi:hypothetical protein
MNVRHLAIGSLLGIALLGASVNWAQDTTSMPFRLRSIRKDLVKAPDYKTTTSDTGGGRPATLYQDWLRIEVQFESRPEWADDIQVKFHVLLGEGREEKLFSGEISHNNVQKGQQHYSAMFVHPNTVQRYGRGRVTAVAVQMFYQGKLVDQLSDPKTNVRWWEKYSPVPGYVLNPLQTPWSVIATERYEPIKATNP